MKEIILGAVIILIGLAISAGMVFASVDSIQVYALAGVVMGMGFAVLVLGVWIEFFDG